MMADVSTAPAPGQSATSTESDLARYRKYLRTFETNKRDEQDEAQLHRKYYHSKQWTDDELKKLKKRNQPPVTDNCVQRKIDAIVGTEQRMRRDPKAYPRTPQHEAGADTATAGVRFVCDQQLWGQVSSNCMHDGLVSGIGVMWCGIAPSAGSPQTMDVVLKHVDPARFVYDPRSVRADFSDARWMGVDLWLDIDEAKEGVSQDIAAKLDVMIDSARSGTAVRAADEDQAEQWADYEHRRIRMVELYEKRQGAWHYCKFTGEVVIESMISPYQDEYGRPSSCYLAWSPYIDEKGNRYGPIRPMKSLQDEINHRRSRFLHELNSRQTFSNMGGSVEDIDKLKSEIAKPDGHLEFQGGEWMKNVGIIDRSQQLKGHFELLMESQKRIENYGPNPGVIGQGEGLADASGKSMLVQRDMGITELSPVFERHRDWKLRVFRAIWARIRQAWTAERWISITDDPKATEFLPINQVTGVDPMTGQPQVQNAVAEIDVDIILDEGPDTMVMQEELLQTFKDLGEVAMGPMGKVIIELTNVPNKERLLKLIDETTAPPPELIEMQKRMAKLEELLAASKVDESIANVDAKRVETITKLLTASTPAAPTTDEFGNVTAPAQGPDPMLAQQIIEAMQQLFPMNYGEPTLEQRGELIIDQPPMPPPGQDMAPQGGQMPPAPVPSRTPMPMLPPPNQMMPESAYG
jgi:hypothetical protein